MLRFLVRISSIIQFREKKKTVSKLSPIVILRRAVSVELLYLNRINRIKESKLFAVFYRPAMRFDVGVRTGNGIQQTAETWDSQRWLGRYLESVRLRKWSALG